MLREILTKNISCLLKITIKELILLSIKELILLSDCC